MKKLIVSALGLLFLTACQTPVSPRTDEITVQLRGTPGLNVCGDYSIDGVRQSVCGQIPMNIRAAGSRFFCDFNKLSAGDLSLALDRGCKSYGSASATTPDGGVKAELTEGDAFILSSVFGY